MKDVCPKCGSHLTLKDGQFGEFMACPRYPECRYTESLRIGVAYEEYQPPPLYCEKCHHTGLLPFIKNGKVITHAFVDCECKLSEKFDPVRLQAEDFDFACSYSWRAYHAEEREGVYLPPLETRLPIEHAPLPPVPSDYLSMAYLQHEVESLKKTSHTHSYKKHTDKV